MDQEEFEPRKLFVGALSWETTKESMTLYFSKFGKVCTCAPMMTTDQFGCASKPRGFGFVTFEDESSVENVLQVPKHVLDGKAIDPKRAKTMRSDPQPQVRFKAFIGGLSFSTEESAIRKAFELKNLPPMKGQTSIDIKKELVENRSRGFAFVEFASQDLLEKACIMRHIMIDGKQVEVKKAEQKTTSSFTQNTTLTGIMPQYAGAYYGNNSITDASRYNTVGNTQYNATGGSGYSPYTQYSNSSYAGYDGNSNVYQNFGANYASRGYNAQQQQMTAASYGHTQPTSYTQGQGSFPPNVGTETYPTAGSGFNYDQTAQTYGYSNDQTGSTTSHYTARMQGGGGGGSTSNTGGGQTRGGTSGYQSYNH